MPVPELRRAGTLWGGLWGPCSAPCPPIPAGPDLGIAWHMRDHDARGGHTLPDARGPPESPRWSWHPQRPHAGSPAPFPARCMPKHGAAEGETRDLTWNDSSRSRDINLVCHSAVSRRSAARCGRDSPQTPGSRADGCCPPPRFAPWGPSSRGPGSSWGGLGDAAGWAAPHATLSAGSHRCPPPLRWVTPSPQGQPLPRLSCPRSYEDGNHRARYSLH